MPRAPDERSIKAKELYLKGYKLVDIAKELGVPDGTVRRWKHTYKWDDKENINNDERSNKRNERSNKKNTEQGNKDAPILKEIKTVINNNKLTDKQKLFCIYYSKCFNATKAYLKAYTCTYDAARVEGCRLLTNPNVKAQIDALTEITFNKAALKNGVLQKYIDIAFADIGDYMTFGKKSKGEWTKDKDGNDIPVLDPETGEQKIIEYSYVELKESTSVDTSLLSEVSQGKFGISIKLIDKMKALDFLNKHLNLLSDEDKIKLELENKKLQNIKLGAEINKLSGPSDGETPNDGFIEALQGKVAEVWKDE